MSSAPQWVELDLGATLSISRILLKAAQTPSGMAHHRIYASSFPNPTTLVDEMIGFYSDGQRIVRSFTIPLQVRYIRIETIHSPSWVAWYEIRVDGPDLSNRLNRIGVRVDRSRVGEFYDTVTGLKFTPRGNNYVRLSDQQCWRPAFQEWMTLSGYHSNFSLESWDAQAACSALTQMKREGYNIVRVFVNDCTVGNPSGSGLSQNYLANISTFLRIAKDRQMYVILTLPYMPRLGGYWPPVDCLGDVCGLNLHYLNQQFIDGKKKYLKDFIKGIKGWHAPLDVIFSYNIENEVYYRKDKKPLSLASGLVETARGSYRMENPYERQHLMDANLVNWINQVTLAVREEDPDALVGVGFFSPKVVEGSDPLHRITRTYWGIVDANIGGSIADYIDLHVYPGLINPITAELDSFEIPAIRQKPILMGEFGVYSGTYGDPATTDQAIPTRALKDLQLTSCNSTYGFAGWLLWTWDTAEQVDGMGNRLLWTALDRNGAINKALAPTVLPNPCLQ
jgi:hypothetical protein